MAIRSMSITLEGRAENGCVAMEASGTRYDIGADRSFSISIEVPVGAKSFSLTSVTADGQRLTRRFQVRRLAGALGAAS